MMLESGSLALRLTAVVAAVLVALSFSLVTVLYKTTSLKFIETQTVSSASHASHGNALASILESAYERSGWLALHREAQVFASKGAGGIPSFIVLDETGSVRWAPASLRDTLRVSARADGTFQVSAHVRRYNAVAQMNIVTTAIPLEAGSEAFAKLLFLPPPDVSVGERFASKVWWAAAPWILVFVILATATTFIVVRVSLHPLIKLTTAARSLRDGSIPNVVPTEGTSEFQELIATFNSAVQSIAATDAMRKSLVSDVAHELRTPVTNLKAQLEALESGLLAWDENTSGVLRMETRILERLVEDFQQVMAFDSGSFSFHRQSLQADEALENLLSPLVAAVGGQLTLAAPQGINLLADEDRLRQVFSNLVDNSSRYVQVGLEVTVTMDASNEKATITYSDNGPGISAHDRSHVFERFYRAEKSRNRSNGGAGLGLTIAKGIVEAMGGAIRLIGTTGAVFEILLPAEDRRAENNSDQTSP